MHIFWLYVYVNCIINNTQASLEKFNIEILKIVRMYMKRFLLVLIFSYPFVGYTQNAKNSTSDEEQKDILYREGGMAKPA